MSKYINLEKFTSELSIFQKRNPFPYLVVDNFFNSDTVEKLASEFPNFDSPIFNGNYNNPIEVKKTCNIWDRFPPHTYKVFHYLNSQEFVHIIETHTKIKLFSDNGLHGGGMHLHPSGGKLNVHLDYNIHPKLGLMRKYNLIVYLNPNYKKGWGGELGLWGHDSENQKPKECFELIEPIFNRAVFFDTTMNSWHGLEVPNSFPADECRKSIALYYLTTPPSNTENRLRALFAPTDEQKDDPEVISLIKRRSGLNGDDPTNWSRT